MSAQPADTNRFHPATLIAHRDAGGGMTQITVDVPRDVAATHTSPGQYVEVRASGRTGFFVLANEPTATRAGDRWDFVMRAGGGASDVLLRMAPGAGLELTGAIGAGFPMDDVRGCHLIVALSGTGMAAGRPIVGRRIAEGDAARTHVFMGIRTRAEMPMRSDLEAWLAAGVKVLVCLSQDDGPLDGIPHAHGYVQTVLRSAQSGRARPPRDQCANAHIFAVGLASMVQGLRELAPELGIPAGSVHTNH